MFSAMSALSLDSFPYRSSMLIVKLYLHNAQDVKARVQSRKACKSSVLFAKLPAYEEIVPSFLHYSGKFPKPLGPGFRVVF